MQKYASILEKRKPLLEFLFISALLIPLPTLWVLWLGGGTISWDALNHHLYLGRQAIYGSRLSQDLFAAGSMTCQYPLGYAPLAFMLDAGWSGHLIFIVLTMISSLIIPAGWLIAWTLYPIQDRVGFLVRTSCIILLTTSVLWWKLLTQTSNDAIGFTLSLWSFALLTLCFRKFETPSGKYAIFSICMISGILAGLAFIVKMTFFVAVLACFCIFFFLNGNVKERMKYATAFGLTVAITCIIAGGEWAFLTFRECGSPIYPFGVDFFQEYRQMK